MERAATILQDGGAVRWPLPEMLGWVNDASREIAIQKPNATAKTVTLAMVAGTRQTLAANHQSLLQVIRNTNGEAITPAVREIIDRQMPGWHSTSMLPWSAVVVHVMDDPMDPRTFYVLPGNTGTGSIEAVVSEIPANIAAPSDPFTIGSYSALIVPLPDIFQNAVVDYVLYRCFSKDIMLASAPQRAQTHYALFQAALGVKTEAEVVANINSPQSRFSQ
jgi:hypothetical protein